MDQQQRLLAVRFYSKWYCATLQVNVIARSFRFASNRHIVCESASIKVYPYQVMIRNGLFEETNEQNIFFLKYFVINYILNFIYIYNTQWKISKWKYYDFVRLVYCTCKLTWVCVCACVCNCMCLMKQFMN